MSGADGASKGFKDVVIVAGRTAYPEYLEYQAYVGHSNRPFQKQVRRMAFYSSGAIQPEIPEILDIRHGLVFARSTVEHLYGTGDPADRDIADLIQVLLEETGRGSGDPFDVVLLSAPDDPKTMKLREPVTNTKMSRTGKPVPITMGQYRYTSEKVLHANPRTTDELDL
jgi:hypothetical protein